MKQQQQSPDLNQISLPNESQDYRQIRNQLLEKEKQLKQICEEVAQLRRQLPLGGILKQNYQFSYIDKQNKLQNLKFSDLFEKNKNTLFLLNFQYEHGPKEQYPCPYSVSLLDGLEGQALYISQKINFYCISNATRENLHQYAIQRNWKSIKLISSNGNKFNLDYYGEDKSGQQYPTAHIFKKQPNGDIHHFWMSELLFAEGNPFDDPRHLDLLCPFWNIFDLTPQGRGKNFYPKINPSQKQQICQNCEIEEE